MPVRMTRLHLACLAAPLLLTACDSKSTDSGGQPCDPPVAEAGVDLSATLGSSVQLDGSGSVVCDRYTDQAVYTWALTAPVGSAVDETALSDNKTSTAIQPVFTPDVTGDYVFSLIVTDPQEESPADMMVVTVTSGDAAPTADCGGAYSGGVNDSITLDGSGSSDPEGAQLEWFWSITDTPDCSSLDSTGLFNSGGPTPTVVPDCSGIFTVSLVVSDGVQYSNTSTCYVEVASENQAPVADAGESTDLGSCADNPLTLDGYGSYDPDADAITYEWTLVSVPTGSAATDANFDDNTSAEPRFTWDMDGDYVFQLQVSDGDLFSAPDLVTMTVAPAAANHAPVANAGEDQEISTEGSCTSSSYVWTCDDCEEVDVELDASASGDPDGDDLTFYWSEATGEVSFTNPYGPVTDAVIGAQAAEYNVDNTTQFTVNLDLADCEVSDNDTVTITYTCTGEE